MFMVMHLYLQTSEVCVFLCKFPLLLITSISDGNYEGKYMLKGEEALPLTLKFDFHCKITYELYSRAVITWNHNPQLFFVMFQLSFLLVFCVSSFGLSLHMKFVG